MALRLERFQLGFGELVFGHILLVRFQALPEIIRRGGVYRSLIVLPHQVIEASLGSRADTMKFWPRALWPRRRARVSSGEVLHLGSPTQEG